MTVDFDDGTHMIAILTSEQFAISQNGTDEGSATIE